MVYRPIGVKTIRKVFISVTKKRIGYDKEYVVFDHFKNIFVVKVTTLSKNKGLLIKLIIIL